MLRGRQVFRRFRAKGRKRGQAVQHGILLLQLQRAPRHIQVVDPPQGARAAQGEHRAGGYRIGQQAALLQPAVDLPHSQLRVDRIAVLGVRQVPDLGEGRLRGQHPDRAVLLQRQTADVRLALDDRLAVHGAALGRAQAAAGMQQRCPVLLLDGDVVQHGQRIGARLLDQSYRLQFAAQLKLGQGYALGHLTLGFSIAGEVHAQLHAHVQLAAVDRGRFHGRDPAAHRAHGLCIQPVALLDMRKADRHLQAAQPAALLRLVQHGRLHHARHEQAPALRGLVPYRCRAERADHTAHVRQAVRHDRIRRLRAGRDTRETPVITADACLIQFHLTLPPLLHCGSAITICLAAAQYESKSPIRMDRAFAVSVTRIWEGRAG